MILVYPYDEKYNKKDYILMGKKGLNKSLLRLNDKIKYKEIIANLKKDLQIENSAFYNKYKHFNLTEIYLLKLITLLERNGKLKVTLNIKDLSEKFLEEIFKLGSIIEFRDDYIIFEKGYITKNKNFLNFYNKKTEIKKQLDKIKEWDKEIIPETKEIIKNEIETLKEEIKNIENEKTETTIENLQKEKPQLQSKRKRGRPRKKS